MKNIKTSCLILCPVFLLSSLSITAQSFSLDAGQISTTESDSRSVNFFDLENDGWQDIYISNGKSGGQKDLLYRNISGSFFLPISGMDPVEALEPSDGASFADYNNDGHIDAVVSSWYGAEDLLYMNNGNAKLIYNGNSGLVSGSFAETAMFFDYDNDGWLDLYITHSGGNQRNFLYRNTKDGNFERITSHTLVADAKLSRAAFAADLNDDGHQDLFIANESNMQNDLFLGTGNGEYEKYTDGSIVNSNRGSMTASWADIDNDGDLDLFVGNSGFGSGQRNQLFRNNGDSFSEISNDPVTQDNKCCFGSAFADFDNDGDLDLAVANGFCNGQMQNDLFENLGDGSFKKISEMLPDNESVCSFGLAWGDVNNDGALELMIANCKNSSADIENTNRLYLNSGNANNWVQFNLKGNESNSSGIGTKIMIQSDINGESTWQRRDIVSQSGYCGQNSLVAHFGLADSEMVDSLVIYWPSGTVDRYSSINSNQILNIEEGFTSSSTEIDIDRIFEFSVYPNPVDFRDSSVQLNIESLAGVSSCEILLANAQGKIVQRQSIQLHRGNNRIQFGFENAALPSGMYQICLQHQGGIISRKLMIN